MDYYPMEESLQVLLGKHLPLSESQKRRISQACVGVMLAGSSHLSQVGKWLGHGTQQRSRERWLRRLLDAQFMRQEFVYAPLVKKILASYQVSRIHLLIDRSSLVVGKLDLLSLSLLYRKHALPLVWTVMPTGMSGYERQIALIDRVQSLLPSTKQIIFHGDNEFGGIPLLIYVRHLGWDVMLGQNGKNCFYLENHKWQTLGNLSVQRRHNIYLSDVYLTKKHDYGKLNLVAFYHPRFQKKRRKRDIRYLATTLPITPRLLVTGKARWGIECQFKDFKSAGWQLNHSCLRDENRLEALLNLLSIAYSWATCLGRWLCKIGKRYLVDAHARRGLSYFRIGWDWLVHQFRVQGLCPVLSRLYH
ncbi:MAG: transposase [Chloroflexota bacterium]